MAVATATGSSACGQGLVPGTAYDHPLFTFSGTVRPTGGLLKAKHPAVGLLWTDPLQQNADLPMPATWMQSSVSATDDSFSVNVFRPPPDEVLVTLDDPAGGTSVRVAVAEIVIFDDGSNVDGQEGDGTFAVQGPRATILAPDMYLAGSAHVLTYVAIPFPSVDTKSPVTVPGQSGYELLTYVCQGQLSAGTRAIAHQSVEIILQPSSDLPTVRTCRATHGP